MVKNKIICFCVGCLFASVAHGQIVSENLTEISNGTIGVPTVFKSDLWGKNPDVSDVLRQIQEAGQTDFNAPERAVLRQILLTDVGGIETLEKENKAYLDVRLNTMLNQGFYEDILTLLGEIPEKQLTAELKRVRLKALFALGKEAVVCSEENMALFDENEAFMRVICADLSAEPFETAMAYEVYRDSGRDTGAFLNAAGDKLYRHLDAVLPEGKPDFWEWVVTAKAFGTEVLNRDLTRGEKILLAESDFVSEDVREKALSLLEKTGVQTNPDGKILDDLIQISNQRQKVEKNLSPDLLLKLMGTAIGE